MSRKVLILTEAGDIHAYAVAEALRRKGAEPILWHTSDFPTQSFESVLFEAVQEQIQINAPGWTLRKADLDAVGTVWRRRPSQALPLQLLHPADHRFVEAECNTFRRSLFDLVAGHAFWVNPVAAAIAVGSKLTQQHWARECGFKVPATLFSNDPAEIRKFLERHGGQIV